jgi:hypothetical protein
MPTQVTNTAADRLLRITREVQAAPAGEQMGPIWARALRVPAGNRIEIFRGILSFAQLIDEVEANVKRYEGNATKLYLRALDQVRHAVMAGLDIPRVNLNGQLKIEIVTDLEHCAAMYSSFDHEVFVPKDQVESIKGQVSELFTEIKESGLPDELRNSLLDLLEVIRQQMAEFEIRGAATLHECLRQSLARLMEIYSIEASKKNEPVLKKLFVIVTGINKLCELAQKTLPTLKLAKKLLTFVAPDANHLISDAVDVEIIPDEKK